MPDPRPQPETAEALLHQMQQALRDAARNTAAMPTRDAMRAVERAYGAQATRWGRQLHDLVSESHAWDVFEGPHELGPHLPRTHELSQCEPVLRLMRESGELDECERLLRERDAALAALWRRADTTEEDRRLATEVICAEFRAGVQRAAAAYRPDYEALRRAASGAAPLTGPRVRSRPFLQPPLMALLWSACHRDGDDAFAPTEGESGGHVGLEYRQGRNALRLRPVEPVPAPGRDVVFQRETFRAWADGAARDDLSLLDPMAWDVAALAVSAFYVRTDGMNPGAPFPVLVDDYLEWRGVDPRKRTRELRRQVTARLELLCSDRLQICGEADLWLTDPGTGHRRRTRVVSEGPLLVARSRIFRRPADSAGAGRDAPDGCVLSLGEWARPFVEARAMRGVALRRLAEYDLQRQAWERRIGWYLVFQLNNQASRMTFRDTVQDGKARTQILPQHPLKMRTVLTNSQVPWEDMAATNPGKVIKQWCDALEALRRDGVIGPTACLDGLADGSDLPARGRLSAMLERRYQFIPGRDLLPHLRAKNAAAGRQRSA